MSTTGIDRLSPVITPGQAGALGVGAGWLTLACDNRVVQGSEAAALLTTLAGRKPTGPA